jgi:hypothetical protein
VCKKKVGHHILQFEARLSIWHGGNGASGVIGSFYFLELGLYCTRISKLRSQLMSVTYGDISDFRMSKSFLCQ